MLSMAPCQSTVSLAARHSQGDLGSMQGCGGGGEGSHFYRVIYRVIYISDCFVSYIWDGT